jgi:transcription elongation factor GreB
MAEKSVYITPEGFSKLQAELDHLWRVERPKVTEAVSTAAALGDRSENADYIYGKKRLREIDKRIRYLTKRLDNLVIVDRIPDDRNTVYFGAWVKLEDDKGIVSELRIVGSDEFDPKLRWISLESPMGKSLIGKKKATSILVPLPDGEIELYILDVSYEPFDEQSEG